MIKIVDLGYYFVNGIAILLKLSRIGYDTHKFEIPDHKPVVNALPFADIS